jgi:hypothetical protein
MPNLDPTGTNVGITVAAHLSPFDGRFSIF